MSVWSMLKVHAASKVLSISSNPRELVSFLEHPPPCLLLDRDLSASFAGSWLLDFSGRS